MTDFGISKLTLSTLMLGSISVLLVVLVVVVVIVDVSFLNLQFHVIISMSILT